MLYVFYREWMAWLLLLAVACLPLLSLLLSLPAMCTVKTTLRCPTEASVGQLVRPEAEAGCFLPTPQISCKLRVRHSITGETQVLRVGKPLDTEHCGVLQITPARVWAYDYLGLWRIPRGKQLPIQLTVLPEPVKPETLPDARRYAATGWRPKAGGGFAENHDLRLYRPGDDLRNIHWKLSSKTGKLIYREPVLPVHKKQTILLELSGDYEQLDDKLGRLCWLSQHYLQMGVRFEVRCLTGRGVAVFAVKDPDGRGAMLRQILSAPACDSRQRLPDIPGALRIGGDGHET